MKRKSVARLPAPKTKRRPKNLSRKQIAERLALLMLLLQHNIERLARSTRSR